MSSDLNSASHSPVRTIVCGDSHTSTHGALGALAFGIGTSEIEHVLATQCLLQQKSETFEIQIDGTLPYGVTAKDIILSIIGHIGIDGGNGAVVEYTGSAIRALNIEERMTVCNMSIEAGARAGMIAPDDTTYEYIAGKRFAPKGEANLMQPSNAGSSCPTDDGAAYDRTLQLDAADIAPQVTWGTNPGMVTDVTGRVPDPADMSTARRKDCYRTRSGIHGSQTRHPDNRYSGGQGFHRQLHQFPNQRSTRRCGSRKR